MSPGHRQPSENLRITIRVMTKFIGSMKFRMINWFNWSNWSIRSTAFMIFSEGFVKYMSVQFLFSGPDTAPEDNIVLGMGRWKWASRIVVLAAGKLGSAGSSSNLLTE
jgi:hypothetical protein